jgi:hypothetical protein
MSYLQGYLNSGVNNPTSNTHVTTFIGTTQKQKFVMKFGKGQPFNSYANYIHSRGFEVVERKYEDPSDPSRITKVILQRASNVDSFIPMN